MTKGIEENINLGHDVIYKNLRLECELFKDSALLEKIEFQNY